MDNAELLTHLDKIHTTPLGKERIRKNLCLNVDDVVAWCVQVIADKSSDISRKGKNWYIRKDDCEITVNAYSYTIITAHKK
ncbi:MAG: DUF3781 domain-containing protein [Synergistaceae bacterium]|jgi:nicotinic acid mononucleotide adenylyltransferase|nr:DUF3781 domain-containing protein [Synergistaceae bacterium]